jgi:enterochelin esterase family protein
MKDVIPFVEKTYRVVANKDNRAIAGLRWAVATPDGDQQQSRRVRYIGVFSSDPARSTKPTEQLEAVKTGGVKFYWTGAGTTDMSREGTMNLHHC